MRTQNRSRWVAYRRPDGVVAVEARPSTVACHHLAAALRRERCTGVALGTTVEDALARHEVALISERCRCCAGGTAALCSQCQAAVLGPTLVASVAVCGKKVA